jgi:cardiolipin synthase
MKLYPKIDVNGNSALHIGPSGPDNKWANLKLIIFSIITTSEKRLWIETPYFVPDDALLMALKSTALQGVDVRIILPDKNDALFPKYASKTFYMELLSAGVKIYEYKKGFIHTKMLISDNMSSVGSTNLDSRSLNLDFEASAFIFDYKVTDDLSKIFLKDLVDCKEITKRDLYITDKFTRFKQSLARLLSPII